MSARRAAVLGSPISHSRSPILHRAAYAALGLDWRYDAIDLHPDGLAAFLAECAAPEWVGLSLTMPLKSDVVPLLDDASELVGVVGAANTVVFDGPKRIGHNTDVPGMQAALEHAAPSVRSVDSASIIGGGATARSAVAALARMGTGRIDVVARRPDRAREAEDLAHRMGVMCRVRDWSAAAEAMRADIVVSTVPPGAADPLAAWVPEAPGALLDVAYGDGDSALVRGWRAGGGATADGLDLLLWQAVDQVRLFTGMEPPVAAMAAALAAERESA